MAFHDKLTDQLTKERGGRHGAKGHDFQRYWALCHLLRLDLERNDFVVLFEFIEDVAVLDAEITPTKIELFQIKKKGGSATWKISSLFKAPKEGKSIVAKLYESRATSPDRKAKIAFVSNAPVEAKLSNGVVSTTLAEFSATSLEDSVRDSLVKAVSTELGCDESDVEVEALSFSKSSLAMDDLETHAVGVVSSYLATKDPDHAARSDVFCKALYGEIAIRSTVTLDSDTFEALRKSRGISKAQLSSMLATTLSRKPAREILESAISGLASANVSFVERSRLKDAARRYLIGRSGRDASIVAALEQDISHLLASVPGDLVSLWDVANWIADEINASSHSSRYDHLGRDYVISAILLRLSS